MIKYHEARLATIFCLGIVLLLLSNCESSDPTNHLNLEELSIKKIHQAYQNGNYSSEQLVQAYLNRIAKLDSSINSITTINPKALEIAQALDAELQQDGVLRPLHGIPMIVKDNFNTKGLPTTAGSLALKDFIPNEDAYMVDRLVKAGAIIIAKSNMAEWAFSPMHTESSTAGTTKNPYNLLYVPAGSSGGTAASVAANFGVIGLGTDTGNSIRGPSSHCALVGFRSTLGLTSRSGIVPLYLRNDVAGPMCRTVEDATRVLEIIAGYDPLDPMTKYSADKIPPNYTQFLRPDGLNGSRIGVLRTLSEQNVHAQIKRLFEQALADMRAQGAEIIDSVEIHNFAKLRQNQWCGEFRKDIEAYLTTYVKSDDLKSLEDIIRVGSASDFASSRLNSFLTRTGRGNNPEIPCLDPYTDQLRVAFREAIEMKMDSLNLDAIVYPTWNQIPARLDSFSVEYLGDNSQIIAPHTGQPAFTVPMGFSQDNLPAGIQFLGRMYDEPTLIKLTYAYEQATEHRKTPGLN